MRNKEEAKETWEYLEYNRSSMSVRSLLETIHRATELAYNEQFNSTYVSLLHAIQTEIQIELTKRYPCKDIYELVILYRGHRRDGKGIHSAVTYTGRQLPWFRRYTNEPLTMKGLPLHLQ